MKNIFKAIKNNLAEYYLSLLCIASCIGNEINIIALVLVCLLLILIISKKKILGIFMGIIIGSLACYLSLAILSDAQKITDFSTQNSTTFLLMGSVLSLSLLFSSILLIKKYK